jgi:hypothetical protein
MTKFAITAVRETATQDFYAANAVRRSKGDDKIKYKWIAQCVLGGLVIAGGLTVFMPVLAWLIPVVIVCGVIVALLTLFKNFSVMVWVFIFTFGFGGMAVLEAVEWVVKYLELSDEMYAWGIGIGMLLLVIAILAINKKMHNDSTNMVTNWGNDANATIRNEMQANAVWFAEAYKRGQVKDAYQLLEKCVHRPTQAMIDDAMDSVPTEVHNNNSIVGGGAWGGMFDNTQPSEYNRGAGNIRGGNSSRFISVTDPNLNVNSSISPDGQHGTVNPNYTWVQSTSGQWRQVYMTQQDRQEEQTEYSKTSEQYRYGDIQQPTIHLWRFRRDRKQYEDNNPGPSY